MTPTTEEHLYPTGDFIERQLGPMQRVIHEVARFAGMQPSDIIGPSRRSNFVRARQMAMLICKDYTDASYPAIGRTFRRDHSTVYYGVEAASRKAVGRDWDDMEAIAKRCGLTKQEAER